MGTGHGAACWPLPGRWGSWRSRGRRCLQRERRKMQRNRAHMVGIQTGGSDAVRDLSREMILITILGIQCKCVSQPYWRKIKPIKF